MLALEERDVQESNVRSFKQTLFSLDPVELGPNLFPEYFGPDVIEVKDIRDIPEGATVEYVSSPIEMNDADYEEAMRILGKPT